jgi:O-antigen ligase
MNVVRFADLSTLVLIIPLLLLGSFSYASPTVTLAPVVIAAIISAIWLFQIPVGRPSGVLMALLALYGLGVVWAYVQTFPLSPGLVESFASRIFVKDALEAANQTGALLPLSLSPQAVNDMIAWTFIGLALFLVGGLQPSSMRSRTVAIILLCIIANLFFAAFQRAVGPGNGFDLYAAQGVTAHAGTFINRNNFAISVAVAIPMVLALTHHIEQRIPKSVLTVRIIGFAGVGVLLVGILISTSRSGMGLGLVALLMSAPLLMKSPGQNTTVSSLLKVGIPLLVLAVGLFMFFGADSLLRVSALDSQSFSRTAIWENTWTLTLQQFPWGSGLGSFVPMYHMIETPEDMIDGVFINHAHNDYLELMLEGGLPMTLLLVLFLAIFGWQVMRVFGSSGSHDVFAKAAAVSASILLLHSLVEFPLRNGALMALFGYCLGLLASSASKQSRRSKDGSKSSSSNRASASRAG